MREHLRSYSVLGFFLRPSLTWLRSRVHEFFVNLDYQNWPGCESGRASMAVVLRTGKRWLQILFSLVVACISVRAQTVQFLPEVDTYLKLNSMVRVYSESKDDRDGGDSTQVTNGPSLQLYLKPILKLKRITAFD